MPLMWHALLKVALELLSLSLLAMELLPLKLLSMALIAHELLTLELIPRGILHAHVRHVSHDIPGLLTELSLVSLLHAWHERYLRPLHMSLGSLIASL